MVTDKKIIVTNGNTSLELTATPFFVKKTKGFDRLNIQIVTSQGYDQDGAYLLNDYVLPRDMEIDGQLKATTVTKMEQLKTKLFKIFSPKTNVTINHYYGGVNRMITARVEKTPEFKATDVSQVLEYNVKLTAVEPYWQDANEQVVQMANTSGKFHFPLAIPQNGIIFGLKSSSSIANIYNYSAVKVGMKIVFVAEGSVTNPQLFDLEKRKFIKLLCEMSAGDRIEIQTGQEKTITKISKGVSEDYIGKIDFVDGGNTFLELEPGDNILRYGADDGEKFLEVKIYYKNKYAGV